MLGRATPLSMLRLLADGLTNRQIAGALFISEKTAEHRR
jgi:DNA-binding NarL/FixJ family response regulator